MPVTQSTIHEQKTNQTRAWFGFTQRFADALKNIDKSALGSDNATVRRGAPDGHFGRQNGAAHAGRAPAPTPGARRGRAPAAGAHAHAGRPHTPGARTRRARVGGVGWDFTWVDL